MVYPSHLRKGIEQIVAEQDEYGMSKRETSNFLSSHTPVERAFNISTTVVPLA